MKQTVQEGYGVSIFEGVQKPSGFGVGWSALYGPASANQVGKMTYISAYLNNSVFLLLYN